MKIDFITAYFYPVLGGAEKHEFHIAKGLKNLGHKVTVHTSNLDRYNKKLKERETIDGIEIKRYNVLFKIGEFASFFPGVFKIRKTNADIIHMHTYRHPYNLIALFAKKPCVLTLHWPNYPKGLRSKINEIIIPIFDEILGKIILKKFAALIAVNDMEKNWIIKKFKINPEKIKVIPNGIPKEDLKPIDKNIFRRKYKIPKNKLVVLCVGRLNKSKGFDQVIKIAKYFPDVQFVILGLKESYLEEIEKLVKANKNVMLLLDKDDKEKYEALAAADIFVAPSHYEAFGIVVIEAFSQKCAVITSDQGGLPWVVDKAGLIFEDNNLEDLKNKLSMLVNNKKLRLDLQKKGYERVKNFTWDKITKDIEKVYKELLKNK